MGFIQGEIDEIFSIYPVDESSAYITIAYEFGDVAILTMNTEIIDLEKYIFPHCSSINGAALLDPQTICFFIDPKMYTLTTAELLKSCADVEIMKADLCIFSPYRHQAFPDIEISLFDEYNEIHSQDIIQLDGLEFRIIIP